jgi:hypothetical protein
MKVSRLIFRMWYYFRVGYTTYLSFLLGLATTLITVYYLAINNIPMLQSLFPHFGIFVVIALVVGLPTACLIGWYHLKGSSLWESEIDIGVEANPYVYKMQPGYWAEAFTPLYLELLIGVKKILEKEGMLSEEEKKRIEDLEKKIEILMKGGYLGVPRKKGNLPVQRFEKTKS